MKSTNLIYVLLLGICLFGEQVQAQNPQYFLYHYPFKGGIGFGAGMSSITGYTGNKWQSIYNPSDFPTMPTGKIKNAYIKMYRRYFDSTSIYYNFTVRIGPTAKSGFTPGNGYENFIPNLPLVFQADTFVIPPCDSDLCWLKIPLSDGDFTYNKGQNFVVEFAMGGPAPINGFDLNSSTGGGSTPRLMGAQRDSTRSKTKSSNVPDLGFDMLPTGLEEVRNVQSFGLFPNPARDGHFRISFDAAKPVRSVQITVNDVTGRCVLRRDYQQAGTSFIKNIDLGTTAPGNYFLLLQADGERIARKLVVE